jgi:hypothetical protein
VIIPAGHVYYLTAHGHQGDIVSAAGVHHSSERIPPQDGIVTDAGTHEPIHFTAPEWKSSKAAALGDPSYVAHRGRLSPPPAVLLRCTQKTPSVPQSSGGTVRMDIYREELLLGWNRNHPGFIKAVLDLDAHHYSIFELAQVSASHSDY